MSRTTRVLLALTGLGASSLAARTAWADMIAEPMPPPAARNSPRCPARRPAFGAPCARALDGTSCSYSRGPAQTTYVCRASRPGGMTWWGAGSFAPRHPGIVRGPLPPPSLDA